MQYQVPQFIDVEDKIFGPFTFKQFLYMVGGLGLSYLIYRFIPTLILSGIPIIIVMATASALAFYKVNERPFINVMESAFKYVWNAKLYLWKKSEPKPKAVVKAPVSPTIGLAAKLGLQKPAAAPIAGEKVMPENYAGVMVPKVSQSKLKDLAWNLDIQERVKMGETARK